MVVNVQPTRSYHVIFGGLRRWLRRAWNAFAKRNKARIFLLRFQTSSLKGVTAVVALAAISIKENENKNPLKLLPSAFHASGIQGQKTKREKIPTKSGNLVQ